MKNNYLTLLKLALKSQKTHGLLLAFFMVMLQLNLSAQGLCSPNLEATFTTFDADTSNSIDAKIKISGLKDPASRVGFSPGPAYLGTLSSTVLYSGLAGYSPTNPLGGGMIVSNLPAPTMVGGDIYTVRVYKADSSCFTDFQVTLPFVNYESTPLYVDIEATLTRSWVTGSFTDLPLGQSGTVKVIVQNKGNKDATGVEYQIEYPSTLQLTNIPPAAYNIATKTWVIGTIPAGGQVELDLVFTTNSRGIKEVKAFNTKLIETDIDSSPDQTNNPQIEDDEGQTCITTHLDYCTGDEYEFTLASGVYTDVIWSYSADGVTNWIDIPAGTTTGIYRVDATNKLFITGEGNFKYRKLAVPNVSCGWDGCCPVKVIKGLPPILSTPNQQAICFGSLPLDFVVNNTQAGYDQPYIAGKGISFTLPAFLPDQQLPGDNTKGNYKFVWFNDNGTNNPTVDSIYNDINLVSLKLPTAVGNYKYKVVGSMIGHSSCSDTSFVTFIVNEKPIPIITHNSPICVDDSIEILATNGSVNPIANLSWSWTGPSGYTKDSIGVLRTDATMAMAGIYTVRASVTFTANGGNTCFTDSSVNIVINPLPDVPLAEDKIYCEKDIPQRLSAILRTPVVSHTGTTLNWFSNPQSNWHKDKVNPDTTSAVGPNTGPYPNTNVSTGAGVNTYYVTITDTKGCQSNPDTLNVKVNPKPKAPAVDSLVYCENEPNALPLTAIKDGADYSLSWTGKDRLGVKDTADTYEKPGTSTAFLGESRYYVSQFSTLTGCISKDTAIIVYIRDTPEAPLTTDTVYCLVDIPGQRASTPLVATKAPDANFLTWYMRLDILENPNPAPAAFIDKVGSEWVYVTQTKVYPGQPNNVTLSCPSPRSPLKITVNPLPTATLIPVSSLCNGNVSLNNAMLILNKYRVDDKVGYSIGSAFNTAASTATLAIVTNLDGIIANPLPNPPSGGTATYTARVQNSFGCIADITTTLISKECACPGGYCEPATITKSK